MQLVEFQLVSGNILMPGMLCWLKVQQGRVLVKLLEIHSSEGKKAQIPQSTVQLPDGQTQQCELRLITPFYLDRVRLELVPRLFQPYAAARVHGLTFTVGESVFLNDEATVRTQTNHTKAICEGWIAFIGEDGALYVAFTATLKGGATEKYLWQVMPDEIEIITERIAIGDRLCTLSLNGPRVHDIMSPKYLKHEQLRQMEVDAEMTTELE